MTDKSPSAAGTSRASATPSPSHLTPKGQQLMAVALASAILRRRHEGGGEGSGSAGDRSSPRASPEAAQALAAALLKRASGSGSGSTRVTLQTSNTGEKGRTPPSTSPAALLLRALADRGAKKGTPETEAATPLSQATPFVGDVDATSTSTSWSATPYGAERVSSHTTPPSAMAPAKLEDDFNLQRRQIINVQNSQEMQWQRLQQILWQQQPANGGVGAVPIMYVMPNAAGGAPGTNPHMTMQTMPSGTDGDVSVQAPDASGFVSSHSLRYARRNISKDHDISKSTYDNDSDDDSGSDGDEAQSLNDNTRSFLNDTVGTRTSLNDNTRSFLNDTGRTRTFIDDASARRYVTSRTVLDDSVRSLEDPGGILEILAEEFRILASAAADEFWIPGGSSEEDLATPTRSGRRSDSAAGMAWTNTLGGALFTWDEILGQAEDTLFRLSPNKVDAVVVGDEKTAAADVTEDEGVGFALAALLDKAEDAVFRRPSPEKAYAGEENTILVSTCSEGKDAPKEDSPGALVALGALGALLIGAKGATVQEEAGAVTIREGPPPAEASKEGEAAEKGTSIPRIPNAMVGPGAIGGVSSDSWAAWVGSQLPLLGLWPSPQPREQSCEGEEVKNDEAVSERPSQVLGEVGTGSTHDTGSTHLPDLTATVSDGQELVDMTRKSEKMERLLDMLSLKQTWSEGQIDRLLDVVKDDKIPDPKEAPEIKVTPMKMDQGKATGCIPAVSTPPASAQTNDEAVLVTPVAEAPDPPVNETEKATEREQPRSTPLMLQRMDSLLVRTRCLLRSDANESSDFEVEAVEAAIQGGTPSPKRLNRNDEADATGKGTTTPPPSVRIERDVGANRREAMDPPALITPTVALRGRGGRAQDPPTDVEGGGGEGVRETPQVLRRMDDLLARASCLTNVDESADAMAAVVDVEGNPAMSESSGGDECSDDKGGYIDGIIFSSNDEGAEVTTKTLPQAVFDGPSSMSAMNENPAFVGCDATSSVGGDASEKGGRRTSDLGEQAIERLDAEGANAGHTDLSSVTHPSECESRDDSKMASSPQGLENEDHLQACSGCSSESGVNEIPTMVEGGPAIATGDGVVRMGKSKSPDDDKPLGMWGLLLGTLLPPGSPAAGGDANRGEFPLVGAQFHSTNGVGDDHFLGQSVEAGIEVVSEGEKGSASLDLTASPTTSGWTVEVQDKALDGHSLYRAS